MERLEIVTRILIRILISIITYLFFGTLIYLMIFCLNGFSQTVDTNVGSNIFTGLLLVLAMCVIFIGNRMIGQGIINLGLGPKSIIEINNTSVYQAGDGKFFTGPRGIGGIVMIVIYTIIIVVLTPLQILLGIIGIIVALISPNAGAFFAGKSIDEDEVGSYLLGLLFYLIALGIILTPLIIHTSRAIKYSCNKYEFELETIEYVDDKSPYGKMYLNVNHPSKEISLLDLTVNFYYDNELVEHSYFKNRYNMSTNGLLSVEKGENEDFKGGIIELSCSTDMYNLYISRSDKLQIEVVIEDTSFRKDTIKTSYDYLNRIDSFIIYSYPEYVIEHDYTQENKTKYENAIKLYNENNFEEALKKFNEIPFYEKSKEYIVLCQNGLLENSYQKALTLFHNENYEEAKLLFIEIIDYKDSRSYIDRCDSASVELKYLNAINKFESKDYENAFIEFKELNDYKDSITYINNIKKIITDESKKLVLNSLYLDALDLLYSYELNQDNSSLCSALEDCVDGYYNTLINLLNLETVNVMEGTLVIKPESFMGCTNVKHVNLPSSLEIIAYDAFKNCTGLENVYVPESVTLIGENAFYGCINLKSINIPINIEEVGGGILYKCTAIEKLSVGLNNRYTIAKLFNTYPVYSDKVPKTLKEIEVIDGNVIPESFFSKLPSTVANIIFKEDIIEVKSYAFSESEFAPIFPKGLKIIGEYSYANMILGDTLTIPEGVEVISDKAFSGTLYHTVNLPSTLKNLGASCFDDTHGDANTKTKVLNYNGTKDMFLSIANVNWSEGLGSYFTTYYLYCKDEYMTCTNSKKEWISL